MKIQLTKPQATVWQSQKRFRVLVAGRRFGKSLLALVTLLTWAGQKKGVYYYVAPNYPMCKSIAWRALKELVEGHAAYKNEAELIIELANGSIIQLKSAENPDSLRGVSLAGLVIDEGAFMKQEVWTDVLRPATSDQQAPVLFISTPKGWNWFKDIYDYASTSDDPNWESFSYTTADGGQVSEDEIESAKRELDDNTFRQEYLASFTQLASQVYSAFDPDVNVVSEMDPENHDEYHIGLDFNVAKMCAVVAYKAGDQLHVFDEITLKNSNTYEMASAITKRYPHKSLIVYPDPSGKSRKTSAAGGVTDFTILEQFGLQVMAPRKASAVADRINNVQALLRNVEGNARLYIHSSCKHLIYCLNGFTYKEGTSEPDKSSGLDHPLDALGYCVNYAFPIMRPVPKINVQFAV